MQGKTISVVVEIHLKGKKNILEASMKREKIACNCKNITYGMIEDAVKNGASSYEEVEKLLKFGTGCGKCKEFIHYFVRDLLEKQNET